MGSLPDVFQEFSQVYGNCLLYLALEEQIFKTDHYSLENLIVLVNILVYMKANPRDIIEIHLKRLKAKNKNILLVKAAIYSIVVMLIILELIGYLILLNRKVLFALSGINMFSKQALFKKNNYTFFRS
ncbi:hypothetical protein [cyanobacterium endosymbiont of Rhopalodia gibberula]|uniref:hypothetical protein n=1 Tax=cyanobacterium endosymbiont of Rhopalodia gibberula TaxID=1763363 RepID=UPI0011AB5335|nr:hypothetical protein [cyanobacterium endosymbiont of Rhopalodia gibberula]